MNYDDFEYGYQSLDSDDYDDIITQIKESIECTPSSDME